MRCLVWRSHHSAHTASCRSDKLSENDPQQKCFTYLAENETLPSTRAAEEDGLHAFFCKIHLGEEADQMATAQASADRVAKGDIAHRPPITAQADAAVDSALDWAKSFGTGTGKGESKYARVLNCRFTRLYFLTLSRLPAHFRAYKDLVMNNVLARQSTGHMGVSALCALKAFILTSIMQLQLAACMISMSWDRFEETITPSDTGVRDMNRWDAIGLEEIDEAFRNRFRTYAETGIRIGSLNNVYKSAIGLYMQDVKDASKGVQKRREVAGQPAIPHFADDIESALRFPADAKRRMPYPFPTTTYVAWIFAVYATIPKAIIEVGSPTRIDAKIDEHSADVPRGHPRSCTT